MEQVEVAAPSATVQWTAQGLTRWWTPQTPSNPSFLAERRRHNCQREEELQGGARRRSSGRRERAATGPGRRRPGSSQTLRRVGVRRGARDSCSCELSPGPSEREQNRNKGGVMMSFLPSQTVKDDFWNYRNREILEKIKFQNNSQDMGHFSKDMRIEGYIMRGARITG